MDISSLESIAAITKVVNPKENLETSNQGVTEKEVANSNANEKTTVSGKSQSPMELKLETQVAINKLLKSINQLLGDGVEKLPTQLKEQLVNIIKQNTDSTNLNDGLANLLRSQKNINQDMLKLADTVVKNLFEQLENNTSTALPKNNNLASSLLKPESMFGDAVPKETLLPENLVEKTLNEILAKTTTRNKETSTTENSTTTTKPPTNSDSGVAQPNSAKVPPEQNSTTNKLPENTNNKPAESTTKTTVNSDNLLTKPSANNTTASKILPEQNTSNKTSENLSANNSTTKPSVETTTNSKVQPEQNLMANNKTTENIKTQEQNISPKPTTPANENNVPTEKPASTINQSAELKTPAPVAKNDLPVDIKSETPMSAANRLVDNLRLAENQALPKTDQEVQTLLLGLKDNLLKLTENNSQLNNLLQKFLQEGKELNKSETVLLNKFISDNLPKLLPDNKIIEQQVSPKEALQILQKNSLSNNNEQTQKDLELLNNASKNINTSEAAKQIKTQVESWSNTIKDLANTFIKSNQNSPDTSKSLQTSFAFMMNGEDGKPKPAHIHIYHEKKRHNNSIEKPAETWLKLSLDYEYAGEVNAVFHLKNESILDIKVSFSESDAIAPFKTFIPDIKNALAGGKLSLTQIVAE